MADTEKVVVEIGPASAYALAVKYGYTGTEAEWVAEMEAKRLEAVNAAASAQESATAAASSQSSAESSATSASGSATSAETNAKASKSYAVGGTGSREGEDSDNAKYYYEKAKNTEIGKVSEEVAGLNNDIGVLSARLDNIASLPEGSTTADAELMDIRVGADGTTYDSAGEAVRSQFDAVNTHLSNADKDISELNAKKITKFYASNLGNATVNDSDSGKFTDMKLYGKSEQKQYTGKNFLNAPSEIVLPTGEYPLGGSSGGVECIIPAGNYVFTFDSSVNGGQYSLSFIYDDDTNYEVLGGAAVTNKTSYRFTLEKNTKLITWYVNVATTISNAMIRQADTDDTYEPYVGGIPSPNPDYPQEIKSVVNPVVKVVGKNLLDISDVDNWPSDGTSPYVKRTFKLLPNTQYTASVGTGNPSILYVNGGASVQTRPKTITTDSTGLVEITVDKDKVGRNECQIELGSVATPYEPYTEQTATLPYTLNAIPVESGGNVTIDGQQYIADYVDFEKKQLVRMVGKVDLGSLEWSYESTYTRFCSNIPNIKNIDSFYDVANMICSHYRITSGVELSDKCVARNDGNNSTIYIRDHDYTDSQILKQAIQGVMLIYELATPETIDLTGEEVQAFRDLATYYPTTNVFVSSDQLDGYTTFNYPLNMANGWNYVMQQIEETRPIIYDTEVKVLENRIDTAILTAMMEV